MRMSQLVGRRIKETPRDAVTPSHVFLIRGAYIRPVSAGIYTFLPIGKRVLSKIERIIREEMNRIDGQEVLFPVSLPAELWQESGRYESVGSELLRFCDRNGKEMVLGMTHEEASVHLARTELTSYKQLPAFLFQIQTKYRDEARPRAGLIRVREFIMKDAYSFHASQECMDKYYDRCHQAYERIFRRIGLKDVLSIRSDSGMMGGKVAHEFMAMADCGEDTIFTTADGAYRANREIATSSVRFCKEGPLPLEKVATPDRKSIDEVAEFLGIDSAKTGKSVFYNDANAKLVLVVIRGDFEVNEIKLRNYLKTHELTFATDQEILSAGAVPGYAAAMDLDPGQVRIIFDRSACETSNLVVGANEEGFHFKNFNFDRDMGESANSVEVADVAMAREGDPDPDHGMPLLMKRGIEVGNIFQLGTKYSEAMACNFLDEHGKSKPMIMGCYGIGLGRSMAAVVEQCNDQYGPVWPFSIAPYEVHVCALNLNKPEVAELAEKIYLGLTDVGIEVLYDDRNEKAGFAFNDADLIGVPFRLIISPKNVDSNQVELRTRDGSVKEMLPIAEVVSTLAEMVGKARQSARG